ncbi:MAG: tetratricopeptide repeat protein, partial [Acidobacteriota bacterium]
NTLAQLPEVKVISWTSVQRFKANLKDPQAVGRKLAVEAVVVGRVLHRQDRLLVSAELVNVRDQRQLWGGRYDRRFADVMDIEADLAQTIGGRLRLKLSREQANLLARRRADDPEAYRLYLKGRRIMVGTRQQMDQAREHFQRAIELQPDFALAYAALAGAYGTEGFYAMRDPADARAKAAFALKRAQEIAPNLAEVHSVAALNRLMDWDWAGAEKESREAIEISPGNSDAHRLRSYYFLALGRFDEAAAACRKAQEFDPLSTRAYHDRAVALLGKRDYDGAIAEFRRALDLNPDWTWGFIKMGVAYTHKGMYAEALAAATGADARFKGSYTPLAASWLGYVYAASGDKKRAREAMARLQEFAKALPVDPMSFATIHAGWGDKERTLALLEQTIAEHWPQAFFLKAWPGLFAEWLESEPRYQALLKRMALP